MADSDDDSPALSAADIQSINSGIAIIVPASAILAVLNQKSLVDQRWEEAKRTVSEDDLPVED